MANKNKQNEIDVKAALVSFLKQVAQQLSQRDLALLIGNKETRQINESITKGLKALKTRSIGQSDKDKQSAVNILIYFLTVGYPQLILHHSIGMAELLKKFANEIQYQDKLRSTNKLGL